MNEKTFNIVFNFNLSSGKSEFGYYTKKWIEDDFKIQTLKDFFTDTARCEANIKAKCPKCKKTFETKQTGLLSFLI